MKSLQSMILLGGMLLALPIEADGALCARRNGTLVVRPSCRRFETAVGDDVIRGLGFKGDPGPGLAITDVDGRQVGRVLRLDLDYEYAYGRYGYGGGTLTVDPQATILTAIDASGGTDWVAFVVDSAGFLSSDQVRANYFTNSVCTEGRSVPEGRYPGSSGSLAERARVDAGGIGYYARTAEARLGPFYFVGYGYGYGSTAEDAEASCGSQGGAFVGIAHPCCDEPDCEWCVDCCLPALDRPPAQPVIAAPVHTVDTHALGRPPFKLERVDVPSP